MNRGKKSGGGAGSKAAEEDIPDEFRCKRSDGKQWRCNARAMENKTLCEKHYNQAKKRAAGASSNSSPKKKTKTNNNSHNHHINESSSLLVDSKSHMITRPSLLLEAEPRLKSSSRVHGNHKHVSDHKHAGHSAKVGRPAHFQNGSSSKDLMRSQFAYLHDERLHTPKLYADSERELHSNNCHQCESNEKDDLILCLKCGKNYCLNCIARCYPELHEDEVHQACPCCCGSCNCKSCLGVEGPGSIFPEVQYISDAEKVKFLKYTLTFIQPLLQQFHQEQCQEVELEVKLRGDASAKAERSKLMKDERLYCDNCNVSIVDLYRSCPGCCYDLCLTCCRELRQGRQPGGEHAGSAEQPSQVRVKGRGKGSAGIPHYKLPPWTVHDDGGIPCPPTERGGCGSNSMVLKRILKSNWIAKLVAEVNQLMSTHQNPRACSDLERLCTTCTRNVSSDLGSIPDNHLRQAASRKESEDNFIYSPTIQGVKNEGLDHFQEHWYRGEPVIIRDVVEEPKLLSWDPKVMWRAIQEGSKSKFIDAFDCLGWHPVQINIDRFFKGYQEGRIHKNGWPELLKLSDWLPSSFFEERLPWLGAEFISALPFHEYTNTKHGVLNLASRIPDDGLRPDFGPKTHITYGLQEELGRGDSVMKLHCDLADKVTVLTHATEIELPGWQMKRIEKFKEAYKETIVEMSLGENMTAGDHDLQHSSKLQSVPVDDQLHPDKESCVDIDGIYTRPDEIKRDTYTGGAALWDVFRRQDVPKLQIYLQKHFHEFRHVNEEFIDHIVHPIHDQLFYLTEEHKRRLKTEFGVEAWTFEQHIGEAVLIPVGCPHQVRNLKSCIHVALEFISPENLQECIHLTDEFRLLPKNHLAKEDRLEVRKLILYAANRAVKDIKYLTSAGSGEVRGEMSFQNTSGLEESSQKMHQKSSEDV